MSKKPKKIQKDENVPVGIECNPEILKIITKIANSLANRFKFDHFTAEDIRQEAKILGLEALPRYDNVRPLENFLRTHIYRRLINLKRNNTAKNDPPCLSCEHYDPLFKKSDNQCLLVLNKRDCDLWCKFENRISRKTNVLHPIDLDEVSEDDRGVYGQAHYEDNMDFKNLKGKIDRELPVEMRVDYLKLLQGAAVPKARREILQAKVKEILGMDEDDAL